METIDIQQILHLFREHRNNVLYSIIYEYLNGLSMLNCVVLDKNEVISIYSLRNEINMMNDGKITGYNELLNNLTNCDSAKIMINSFTCKNNEITILISDKKDKLLGVINKTKEL